MYLGLQNNLRHQQRNNVFLLIFDFWQDNMQYLKDRNLCCIFNNENALLTWIVLRSHSGAENYIGTSVFCLLYAALPLDNLIFKYTDSSQSRKYS